MAGLSRLIAKELSEALGTTLTKADDTVKALGEVPVKGIVSNNEYENILRSADTIDNIKDWKASVKATVAEQRKITAEGAYMQPHGCLCLPLPMSVLNAYM